MAKATFSELANAEYSSNKPTSNQTSQVGFFSLKQDKEEAIVRILIDSADDFDIYSVHTIKYNDKFRKISCLRTSAKDPTSKCPFCAINAKDSNLYKRANKVYVRLLQYSTGANGEVVCEAKIWERPYKFAVDLNKYLEENGPLSNYLFKITRYGAPKDMQTEYKWTPLMNKAIYNDESYPMDNNAFKNYDVLSRVILNKSFNDCATFIDTGSFPEVEKAPVNTAPAPTDFDAPPVYTKKQTSEQIAVDSSIPF